MPRSGTPGGREVVGLGAGGDQTVYLDQLAEGILVRHLEQAYRSGLRFHLISEELGERDFGGDALVLADPLDGSVNAKMGLPYYAVVLAATQGDRFQDVRLGYVQNLVTGAEFHALSGGGAFRDGHPLQPDPPPFDGRTIPVVQLDAPTGVDPREGAAIYSQAGGLGVRVKELSRALAERGYETHLFFVGDPTLPADESALEGRLWLHRWSQWISRYHPVGVYEGEDDKVADLNRSLPDALLNAYIKPA